MRQGAISAATVGSCRSFGYVWLMPYCAITTFELSERRCALLRCINNCIRLWIAASASCELQIINSQSTCLSTTGLVVATGEVSFTRLSSTVIATTLCTNSSLGRIWQPILQRLAAAAAGEAAMCVNLPSRFH